MEYGYEFAEVERQLAEIADSKRVPFGGGFELTPYCNLSCKMCYVKDVRPGLSVLNGEQWLEIGKQAVEAGVFGVVLTGGEPLLQKELPQLLEKIKTMGFLVKLDTNGSFPDILEDLIARGLVDYVAMDIKNSPQRYAQTVGRERFDLTQVEKSIALLLKGTVDYEFRTTVVAQLHNEETIHEIGKWIRGAKRYFLQCFVPRDTVLQAGLDAPAEEDMKRYAEIARIYVPETGVRGM